MVLGGMGQEDIGDEKELSLTVLSGAGCTQRPCVFVSCDKLTLPSSFCFWIMGGIERDGCACSWPGKEGGEENFPPGMSWAGTAFD